VVRILYVDSDQAMLGQAREFLERLGEGFQVDTATSGREALRRLSAEEYGVVVSGYRMPRMDGLEFLSELRNRGDETPLLIFTGEGGEEVAVEAFRRGVDGYVIRGGNSIPVQRARLPDKKSPQPEVGGGEVSDPGGECPGWAGGSRGG